MTTRPRIVRAGRPFEVILLVQNAVDDDIDVTMALTSAQLWTRESSTSALSATRTVWS